MLYFLYRDGLQIVCTGYPFFTSFQYGKAPGKFFVKMDLQKTAVVHRRTITLDGPAHRLVVRDELVASASHRITMLYHLAETCGVTRIEPRRFAIDTGRGAATIALDPRLNVSTRSAGREPIGGWVSRGYHHLAPSTTVIGECEANGPLVLLTQISFAARQGEEEGILPG